MKVKNGKRCGSIATTHPLVKKMQAPVHTRWEHIGNACCQFVSKVDGFRSMSIAITNTEKSASQRNKVASDLCSLLQEKSLVTMAYFLSAYHQSYWIPNFSWLKTIDEQTKVSGFASRHMSLRTFVMQQRLQKLMVAWSIDPCFTAFMNRKNEHNEQEQHLLHNTLPIWFFEDVKLMFSKHFIAQWCGPNLLKLTLASIPETSTSFARWLLNLPMTNETIFSKTHDESTHLPTAVRFIAQNASIDDIKQQSFFIEYKIAIEK